MVIVTITYDSLVLWRHCQSKKFESLNLRYGLQLHLQLHLARNRECFKIIWEFSTFLSFPDVRMLQNYRGPPGPLPFPDV